MIEVGDEKSYIHYAEVFIFRAQDFLRKKVGLEGAGIIPVCERLEDHAFRRALKENAPVSHGSIWMKKEAILHYHHNCQKMLRTLELGECDWRRTFEEGKSSIQAFYTTLLSENFKFHVRKQSQHPTTAPAAPKAKVVRPVLPKAQTSKAGTKSKASVSNKKQKLGPGGVTIPAATAAAAAVGGVPAATAVDNSNSSSSSMNFNRVSDAATVSNDFDLGFFGGDSNGGGGCESNLMMNENSLMSGEFSDAGGAVQTSIFNESAWTSVLTSRQAPPPPPTESSSSSAAGVNQWNGAREELLQKQRYEEESLRQQETQKHNVEIQRQAQLQSLRDQQEAAERRRQQEDLDKAERQKKLEEDRERARRELNEQKQTIYLDNAADKDE